VHPATPLSATWVRALRLIDPSLCGISADPVARNERWLVSALLGHADISSQRIAADIVDEVLRDDPSPLDGLLGMADSLIDFRNGVPYCREPELWHLLGYELDAELLVASALSRVRSSPSDPREFARLLSWPSVLAIDGFAVEQVLRHEVADTHVHLGGALPATFAWVAVMVGAAVPRSLAAAEPRWARAIEAARSVRRRLWWTYLRGATTEPPRLPRVLPSPEEPFCDPLLDDLIPDRGERLRLSPVLGERRLLFELLARVRPAPGGQTCAGDLETDLLTYLRTRNSFIRFLSHGYGDRGLARFSSTLSRHHVLFPNRVTGDHGKSPRARRFARTALALERFRMRHALRYQFSDPTDAPWARDQGMNIEEGGAGSHSPWRPPRQIEFRVTALPHPRQLRTIGAWLQGIRDFVTWEHDAPPIRVGFVFHILRGVGQHHTNQSALWTLAGLLSLLDREPGLRPFIVGVDTAGDEIRCSPRDVSAFYRKVRQRVEQQRIQPGKPPVRLGRTVHAGEDFRELFTGLRYVDEAITLLDLRPGDRIGHGLAIAIDPADWYRVGSRAQVTMGDHALDLLWAIGIARMQDSLRGLSLDVGRVRETTLLLRRHLGTVDDTPVLSDEELESLASRTADPEKFPSEAAVLAALKEGTSVADWGRLLELRVDQSYIDLVAFLRARVLARLEYAEVIIEACPTSNLLIGAFGSYDRLPYLNLHSRHIGSGGPTRDVPFSINTDDPGFFRTTIGNEYRLLGWALLRAGHPRNAVVRWLDEARRTGIESCFIPRWSPPTRGELLFALRRLRLMPERFDEVWPKVRP
jgi:adenosine deaminase